MRCFIRPVATAAVLVVVAASANPAHAQNLRGSYLPPYAEAAYPRYPATGAVIGTGGLGFNGSPLYGGFRGGYSGIAGYGGDAYYSSRPYYNSEDRALYPTSPSASRGLFGWRRNR